MYPNRIVCLTEETTETLYLLDEGERVVGISGYTVRPPEARQEAEGVVVPARPLREDRGARARPDPRVLGSAGGDHQRARAARLSGVHLQPAQRRRDPADDPRARRHRRRAGEGGGARAAICRQGSSDIRASAAGFPRRPRVYFEEWDNPLISGIQWVEELIEIAGGDPVFPQLRHARARKGSHRHERAGDRRRTGRHHRIVVRQAGAQGENRAPGRAGTTIPAVRDGHIYEVKSTYILQPGPASLTEGVRTARIHRASAHRGDGADGVETDSVCDWTAMHEPRRRRRARTAPPPRGGLPARDRPSSRSRRARCAAHDVLAHLLRVRTHEVARLASGCANAYSTLRRMTRFIACWTSSGNSRLTTMPPSGIGAPVLRFPELAEIEDLSQAPALRR